MSPFRPGYQPPPMDKRAQAVAGRRRRAELPLLSDLGLEGPIEDHACSVPVAAGLTGVSHQAIRVLVRRGHLAAYQHEGRTVVLLDDLAETPAARAQAEQAAEQAQLAFWSKDRHENPLPKWMTGGRVPCPTWCVYPGCQNKPAVGTGPRQAQR
jgi:hypothetical protein